jgi:nuclear polyadenylated RNA-binding protein 3
MFLHPNFPRESVIERQIMEGVHAVAELDVRAHSFGKIPLQVFDRSAGMNSVRFDQYQDLDPPVAAEVVVQAKAKTQQAQYQLGYGPGSSYPPQYGGQPAYQPQVSPQTPNFPAAPPAGLPHQPTSAADIAGMVGQIDNATLQRLLANLQQPGPGHNPMPNLQPSQALNNTAVGVTNSQVDIQALLGSIKAGAPGGHPAPVNLQAAAYGAAQYGLASPAPMGGSVPGAQGSSNDMANVQKIMSQLARYRQ